MTRFDPDNPPAGYFVYRTETHFDQLDGQMVLHHPRYLVLVERAQQAWIEQVLGAPRFDWRNYPDMYLVVRRIEADYLRPVDGVMDLIVVLRCTGLRAATMTIAFEIRSADGAILYARGERLNCKVDPRTHEPRLWSDAFAERFARLKEVVECGGRTGCRLPPAGGDKRRPYRRRET